MTRKTTHPNADRDAFSEWVTARNPDQTEFLQAVDEVADSVWPMYIDNEAWVAASIFQRLCEPDRVISFRVTWEDDDRNVCINRGYRVQHTNATGPYKGGLRFHPSVNESILKFLSFEQCFKNSLTGMPLGSGKGGADFNPQGRSDAEIMRFCQSFMIELHRHIGDETDVPAGDINVGRREIGYLFGAYKRLSNQFHGALTGKGASFGGSALRPEATGYGLIYFVRCALGASDDELDGKRVIISGAGNVATHAAEKALALGASVISLSDSKGTLHCEDGFRPEDIEKIQATKANGNALAELAEQIDAKWLDDETPWHLECDIALPCATQNELHEHDANTLVENGCALVAEGANMPATRAAKATLREAGVTFLPGKAANAGGVAVSGLEMSQNATRRYRSEDEIDESLKQVMSDIHGRCVAHGQTDDSVIDYAGGADRAGFERLAQALFAMGIV